MRLKKGSKVEVLSKKEGSSGAWRCAEIISRNGRDYSVRYSSGMDGEAVIESISRKAIRPCPPTESVDYWAVGDLVEVFLAGCWKMVVISTVMDEDFYLVRLLGSCHEFKSCKSDIRIRKSWQDGRWITIGKGSKVHSVGTRTNLHEGVGVTFQENTGMEETNNIMSRASKRLQCLSCIETCSRKKRAVEKEDVHHQLGSGSVLPLFKKVDAIDFSRENLGEKYLNTSSNNETTGYIEMERGVQRGRSTYFFEKGRVPNDYDSDVCSVGSCSVDSNSPDSKLFHHNCLSGPSHDGDTSCCDAESSNCCRDEEEKFTILSVEDERVRIHRLEVYAYRSTLLAMFSSGPLSWEQEALLTNLRISLNISDDEHLIELRNLISS